MGGTILPLHWAFRGGPPTALDAIDVHLLMNHKLPGMNAGYITVGALADYLCAQQERMSEFIPRSASPL